MSKGAKETFLMLADMHSFTTVHDKNDFKRNTKQILLNYMSLLPEDHKIVIFQQSALKRHMDITWFLSSVTPYSLILRSHVFKDSQVKNHEINMATFNYSILMTADIINFDADIVPVWKDQQQHIEFARDIAENFNKTYKSDVFRAPEGYISDEIGVIPWLDGRKMSKSYDNYIGIFDDAKKLKKKVMSIVTDDKWLDEPKEPETCNVFALIKLFATKELQDEIAAKYRAWGYWYWHAKLALLEILLDYFGEARTKYNYYEENYHLIEEALEKNNAYASSIVDKKYEQVAKTIGLK